MEEYKRQRNKILAKSDWTQMPDAEDRVGGKEMVKAWAEYRKKVHEAFKRLESGKVKSIDFPNPPQKKG